jgi:hypothetical protein
MKRAIAVAVPIVAFVAIAQSAFASGPTITRYPKQSFDYVDYQCGFAVHNVGTTNEIDILWDGVRLIQAFPQTNEVATNVATGRSIHINFSGGGRIKVNPDGSGTFVGTGNWLWGYNPYTGEPGGFATSGTFTYTFDSQGNVTFSIVGEVKDLCAEIAS